MPSPTTPITGAPLIEPNQAGAEEAISEAAQIIDAFAQLRLASITTAAEPATAAPEGIAYFLATIPTGPTWAGQGGRLAVAINGAWRFVDPVDGLRATLIDQGGALVIWDSAAATWRAGNAARSPTGVSFAREVREEIVTLAGASVQTSPGFLPNGSHVLAVRSRVLSDITGATGYDCGRPGAEQDYGAGLGTLAGSAYHGMSQGLTLYADTPVVITANGAPFAGGEIVLTACLDRNF